MEDFDFIKAFADVEILKVEAIGRVVGRAIGAAFAGMVEAGLSEKQSLSIIKYAMTSVTSALAPRGGGS
jgi:hypothetical protein